MNQTVRDYSAFDRASESIWNVRMYDDIVSTMLERCAPFSDGSSFSIEQAHILDVGCGPGGMTLALLRQTRVASVSLLDLRKEGLERAADRIHSHDGDLPVHLLQADVHAIPVKDNQFDFIFSRGSQRFWEDQRTAFSELRRVLKKGGIAYIGGGRGSTAFQELRLREDGEWCATVQEQERRFLRTLPMHILDDAAYEALFNAWGDRYHIFSHTGDGHWFCWQKSSEAIDGGRGFPSVKCAEYGEAGDRGGDNR